MSEGGGRNGRLFLSVCWYFEYVQLLIIRRNSAVEQSRWMARRTLNDLLIRLSSPSINDDMVK
ncbi:hypothetical protein CN378_19565 [Bacillus sp. AFS015802]|nr:hypothetical protein CN378_19565 [Bacillus sp. AFS015802]